MRAPCSDPRLPTPHLGTWLSGVPNPSGPRVRFLRLARLLFLKLPRRFRRSINYLVPSRLAGCLDTRWKVRLSSRGWGCHGGCNLGALLSIRFETADTGDPTTPEPQETHGDRAVNIGVVYMCVLFVVVLRQKIKPLGLVIWPAVVLCRAVI